VAKLQIEKVLEKKGMSKRQFAKLIVEDYGNVFRFFRPGYDPKLSTLNKWAKALNVKVKDLLVEETSS
jgi:ribosome-binding protein aMBF1 (putative translation factor)